MSAAGRSSGPANPPGRSIIAFRAGDFNSFRRALLEPRAGERALLGWHPAPGDLALQLLEWWAYLGDVLTFYNERIANESYLRTAELPGSVEGLVELLGYQPRPAIGATGQVALLRSAAQPHEGLEIPAGLPLASTATPGVPVQTFETAAASFAGAADLALVLPPTTTELLGPSGDSVLLAEIITGLKPGDEMLLAHSLPWASGAPSAATVSVRSAQVEDDPQGAGHTRVVLDGLDTGLSGAQAADYHLMRSVQSAALWTQNTEGAIVGVSDTEVEIHLLAAVRALSAGDLIFLDGGSAATGVALVAAVSERFRTVPFPQTTPTTATAASATTATPSAVPIAHTVLTVSLPPDTGIVSPPPGLAVAVGPTGGGFAAGQQCWMVTAVVGGNESVPSAEVSATVPASGSASLTWGAVRGATAYKIYRAATSGGEFTSPALVDIVHGATTFLDRGNVTSGGMPPSPAAVRVRFGWRDVGRPIATPAATLDRLPATVTLVYTDYLPAPTGLSVRPTRSAGSLIGSFVWQVTALSPLGETVGSLPASASLGGLSMPPESSAPSGGSTLLTWNAVEGAVGYNIYRAPAGEAPALVGTVSPGTSSSWVDTGTHATGGPPPAANTAAAGDVAARLAMGDLAAFVQDADGAGIAVTAAAGDGGSIGLEATDATPPTFSLTAPLRLLVDLVEVSRGETVAAELLGTGDASRAGQTFALAQSPLTYLQQGAGYASTLQVAIDGVAWTETPTFFGQPPDATVFVVTQQPDGTSIVRFGDGINGARLPTGGKVVATYRHGAGAAAPPAGRLTTVLRPQPNLSRVANPVAVSGGADAEPPTLIRQNAPRSVLTFGRAISAEDYEAVAAQAPGVARARAYAIWNADQQRTVVTVFVGDDQAAVAAAAKALINASDPNRPVNVTLARSLDLTVAATLLVAPGRDPVAVLAAAAAALADPAAGLFSASSAGIGRSLHRSNIEAALLVDGAVAVHALSVSADDGADPFAGGRASADPGQGAFFRLSGPPQLTTQLANA